MTKKKEQRSIEIYDVYVDGKLRNLKQPLKIEVERDKQQRYILHSPDLDLFAAHRDLKTGIESIKKDFDTLWKNYAITNDLLADDAKKFREKLLKMVK
ncbi:MAG: hypothetical protein KKD44_27265 [Proteobacteria bacterium]|nr:hypothetical protein [Pseudomonadota bacterium]